MCKNRALKTAAKNTRLVNLYSFIWFTNENVFTTATLQNTRNSQLSDAWYQEMPKDNVPSQNTVIAVYRGISWWE